MTDDWAASSAVQCIAIECVLRATASRSEDAGSDESDRQGPYGLADLWAAPDCCAVDLRLGNTGRKGMGTQVDARDGH